MVRVRARAGARARARVRVRRMVEDRHVVKGGVAMRP